MFCTNCGAQVEDNAAFCTSCGTPMEDGPVASAQVETPGAEAWQAEDGKASAVAEASQESPHHTTALGDAEAFESIPPQAQAPVFGAGSDSSSGTSAIDPETAAAVADAMPAPAAPSAGPVPAPAVPISQHAPAQAPQAAPAFDAQPVPMAQTTPMETSAAKKKMEPKKIAIIISCVSLVTVIAILLGVFAFTKYKENETAHITTEVQFAFSYSGDTENQPIGVPLLVEGTDLDGNHAEQQILATSAGGTLDLLAGSYTIKVDGQPASSNGVVYEVQGENEKPLEIPVPNEDEEQTAYTIIPDLNYSFTVEAPEDVTDSQIDAIKDWMKTYGVDPNEITHVAAQITERRSDAVARITLEREKQAALNANPPTVYGTNVNPNAPASQLTGTVHYEYANGSLASAGGAYVCYLQLPRTVELVGTQYTGMSSDKVILPNSLSSYQGQVVTISSHFSGRPTATIPSAVFSQIHAYDAQVVRSFG